jgi:pimeloyl-ACP methyl ester carboxylesterase
MSQPDLVLPRPSAPFDGAKSPIPGPSESSFTSTFGTLLPPARYLTTDTGKAAYYEFPPSSSSHQQPSNRVLFLHGVQTPALGMYPLTHTLHDQFPHKHFVLLDLWGHGLSDTPIVPHDPNLFLKLIDALLDHLDWPSAHLVGFSFGGALTVGYVASRMKRVQSFTLVAPAGLRHLMDFDDVGQAHIRGGGDEVAARKWVIETLEGGELVVPSDWKERVAKGEVVAQAVREWQLREHKGHGASVVAVFRDGGVMDIDESFVKAVKSGLPNLVVLGADDDVCTEAQLVELGFRDVKVVPDVGHGVVRERAPEVAGFVAEFWKRLEEGTK